jgi:hypothetical protein
MVSCSSKFKVFGPVVVKSLPFSVNVHEVLFYGRLHCFDSLFIVHLFQPQQRNGLHSFLIVGTGGATTGISDGSRGTSAILLINYLIDIIPILILVMILAGGITQVITFITGIYSNYSTTRSNV